MTGHEYEYKVNLKAHLDQASTIILLIVFGIILVLVNDYYYKTPEINMAPLFIVLGFLYFTDATLLHIKYTRLNKDTQMDILNEDTMQLLVKDRVYRIHSQDVASLEFHLPATLYYRQFGMTPSADYAYARLELKTGEVFYLTSLLMPGLPVPKKFDPIGLNVKRISAFPKQGRWTKDPTRSDHFVDSIKRFLDKIE